MTTKTNISLEYANDILFHIGGEKPLNKTEITSRVIEIRNTLSELLPLIDKLETENKLLKEIKSGLIKRISSISHDNLTIDFNLMESARAGRQLHDENITLKAKLIELESSVLKAKHNEQRLF